MQSIFNRISQYGLADWSVVLQGVCGTLGNLGHLPPSCVEKFASTELEKVAVDDPVLDVIVSLANDSDLPASELCPQLQKICESKELDIQRAKRIWRVGALEEVLSNLDSDPLYGLIKLSDFWSSWNWPADAPPSMLPGAKALPECDYHSVSNYEHVIRENEQWLKDEIAILK